MTIDQKCREFLLKHFLHAAKYDSEKIIAAFQDEMDRGLAGRPSTLAMIPSYVTVPDTPPKNEKIIVLDAGGTNFRVAVVRFDGSSAPHFDSFTNHPMPGVDREVSCDEFFGRIVELVAPVIDASSRLGFCFSYPAAIDRSRDGMLLYWTKEIKAPGVVGRKVLAELAGTLRGHGLPVPHSMLVLNDTIASLMAGVAAVKFSPHHTYAGFILGTGTNTSYVEENGNITKEKGLPSGGFQAVNVESANFSRIERGAVDKALDRTTDRPGKHVLEKMVSGAYLGPLCSMALRQAAAEKVLSPVAARFFEKRPALQTRDLDAILDGSFRKQEPFSALAAKDRAAIAAVVEAIVERAAKLTAVNLAVAVLRSAGKESAGKKVCVSADGSVYYKLYSFRGRAEKHLAGILRPRGVEYEIVKVDEAPLIGAAVAGLA